MNRVTHFEVDAGKPERVAKFFTSAFGWKIKKWDGPMDYWMIDTGKGRGIGGGLVRRGDDMEATAHVITVSFVDSQTRK